MASKTYIIRYGPHTFEVERDTGKRRIIASDPYTNPKWTPRGGNRRPQEAKS
ncbi:MAG TPA: hypothetical protein VGC99_10550 [Candidatus Tectomicrobia bacterium]